MSNKNNVYGTIIKANKLWWLKIIKKHLKVKKKQLII